MNSISSPKELNLNGREGSIRPGSANFDRRSVFHKPEDLVLRFEVDRLHNPLKSGVEGKSFVRDRGGYRTESVYFQSLWIRIELRF
jgi:hypothetical protein